MSKASPKFHYYAIIAHPSESKVLMQQAQTSWSLPHFVPTQPDVAAVNFICQAVKLQLGMEVVVLCCLSQDFSFQQQQVTRIYALENRSLDWKPTAELAWISREELDDLVLEIPEHRSAIASWLTEMAATDRSGQRVPWARMGWFNQATAWIEAKLEQLELRAIAPIEPLKAWAISCILRIPTTSGNLYFKAVPTAFAQEARFTKTLSTYYPTYLPNVLAVHPQHHWMLLQDFGSQVLAEVPDINLWESALRQFARIQIDCIERRDSLLTLGWPDRRLHGFTTDIDTLFADTTAMLLGKPIGLRESEVEELLAFAPKLKRMCTALAELGIPETLVHSDFWSRNIAVNGNAFIYFDWPTSCVAHPFFDLVNFLYIEKEVLDVPDVRTRLCNAYLEPWTIYAPTERLIAAFELSRTLGILYQALTYHRIVLNLESLAKWEFEFAVPLCLKKLLRHKATLL